MKSRNGYDATAMRSRELVGKLTFGCDAEAPASAGNNKVPAASVTDWLRNSLRVFIGKKYYPMLPLRWKVEVHIVLGCDRHAVKSGWLIAPLAKSGDDFFVDPVADRLHDSRLDHVALRVDGDLYNDITLQVARQF